VRVRVRVDMHFCCLPYISHLEQFCNTRYCCVCCIAGTGYLQHSHSTDGCCVLYCRYQISETV